MITITIIIKMFVWLSSAYNLNINWKLNKTFESCHFKKVSSLTHFLRADCMSVTEITYLWIYNLLVQMCLISLAEPFIIHSVICRSLYQNQSRSDIIFFTQLHQYQSFLWKIFLPSKVTQIILKYSRLYLWHVMHPVLLSKV